MIPDEIKREVLERVDTVALIGRHTDLRKAGTLYKGCCPFHEEKTPSFVVYPTDGHYHCFGCQAHGDALTFVMETESLSFPEAIRRLAAEVGVEVPEDRRETPEQRKARQRKRTLEERLLRLQDQLCAYYTEALFGGRGAPARRYLQERAIERRSAEAFRLGWADGEAAPFQAWLEEVDADLDDLDRLGILVKPESGWQRDQRLGGGYLRFRQRLMFPVIDIRGEVVGFSGRILDKHKKAAKYINSPETPVYTKGDHLYGAHTAKSSARKAGRLVVVEGNVDVVRLWQAGLQGTVCPLGTALTDRQARLAKRLSEHVVSVMDGDAAGTKAAFASLEPYLRAGVQPRAVLLPDGEDPDSYVQAQGVDAFKARLDSARPLLELHIERAAHEHPADTDGRLAALRAVAPAMAALDDPLAWTLYRKKAAETLSVDPELVEAAKADAQRAHAEAEARRERRRGRQAPPPPAAGPQAPPSPRQASAPPPEALGPPPVDMDLPEEPPPWLAETDAGLFGPPGGDLEPLPEALAGPDVGERPPEPPPASRPVRLQGYEAEVLEYILLYPEFINRFQGAGAGARLTDPRLLGFFAGLYDAVQAGRTPNVDRLLDRIADPAVVAYVRQRQADCTTRHGNLTRDPARARETFEQALQRLLADRSEGEAMRRRARMRRARRSRRSEGAR